MDKQNRPYKCNVEGCDRMAQGFTYCGGLIRHQREVHKMHGGIKALFCHIPDCKRNSGPAFTRQTNLDEHIRHQHPDIPQELDESPAEGDENNLRAELKKLRRETDTRLRKLEAEVSALRSCRAGQLVKHEM
ncbi:hypothetical protein DM02DRAFT_199028 [Periconia macrospinosa]|uniref:C2H2-type domain-containing protein n=1 Tax=Periconia macrospinosa TaxID=97972 RepID=A0A2V1DAM5_9PLEO|nr:hypothetical protein DM02DRAFT_199028 [Periconia macrospinosa]